MLPLVLIAFYGCNEDKISPDVKGTIQGQILDAETYKVISKVNVYTTPATNSILTDDNGNFTISPVDTGSYTVQAKKFGYTSNMTQVRVQESDTAEVTLLLEKKEEESKAPVFSGTRYPEDGMDNLGVSVVLSWKAEDPEGAEVAYDVVLYSSDQLNKDTLNKGITDTFTVAENLNYDQIYHWQVVAEDSSGNTTTSDVWNFKTMAFVDYNLVYVRKKNGNYEVYGANVNTGAEVRLTHNNFREWAPRINEATGRLSFISDSLLHNHVFTVDKFGNDMRKVTQLPVDGNHNLGNAYAWGPDGRLFYSHYNKLYRINNDGSGQVKLAELPDDRNFREVDVSPSGDQIVALAIGNRVYNSEILLLSGQGAIKDTLWNNPPGQTSNPVFAVDGKSIIFSYDQSGVEYESGRQLDADILNLNLETRDTTLISSGKPDGTNDLEARYSSTGAEIVFMNVPNDGSQEPSLLIMDAAGENRETLTEAARMPYWF